MSWREHPWPVIVIAILYLLVGLVGFTFHFSELLAGHPDAWAIEATELLAAVSAIGLLMRQNWARWLALAWIVFHVCISLFHPLRELAVHVAFCLLIAWALFQPESAQWFKRTAG